MSDELDTLGYAKHVRDITPHDTNEVLLDGKAPRTVISPAGGTVICVAEGDDNSEVHTFTLAANEKLPVRPRLIKTGSAADLKALY